MKSQKGVTLASLTIYVIVAGIVVIMLAFLNVNFFSRMNELTSKTNITNQYSKFCSSFIRDLKGSDSVLEYNQNEIKFSNGSVYEIRKLEDEDRYAVYKNSVKVCENIKAKWVNLGDDTEEEYVRSPYFDYDHLENTVTVILCFASSKADSYEFEMQQIFSIGGEL